MLKTIEELVLQRAVWENKIERIKNKILEIENELCLQIHGFGIGSLVEYAELKGIVTNVENGVYGFAKMKIIKQDGKLSKNGHKHVHASSRLTIIKKEK